LQHQISHQFRTGTQFLPVGLCNHLALETGQGMMCDPRDVLYIKPSDYHKGHLADLAATKEKYTCIQSLDEFAPIDMADIRTVLSKKYAQYLPDSVVQKYTQNPRPTGP
jgi:hypothetical protein